ncbi:GNAT family N-acetyltransferase [Brucepastera parasyntrophica]|uniref:UPF0158 family protein n=1 Tax=Brucepastera parasyntrophica TaxID=2880008 RepID=UPI00210C36E1|nr:UPF0158 family protein [Brucepastera parasyntrophica]ULQ59006.1 GNAT family N-acetyltransferase [Brucepastera parasyntrophica]
MQFDLTPEITDEIVFAMEDQSGVFLFDSVDLICILASEVAVSMKDDRYYAIPEWDSAQGFRIMERFVARAHNPVIQDKLRSVLASGRGVFRNFKNILREHPEIEQLWFQFKDAEMKNIVLEWYNTLCDFWGVEKLGPEPEETEEILVQDFLFRPFRPDDAAALSRMFSVINAQINNDFPRSLTDAVLEIAERLTMKDEGSEKILVAETSEGEIIAASTSAPIPKESSSSVHITWLGVLPEFRGLGIGTELLNRTVHYWGGMQYQWIIFSNPVMPVFFHSVLRRTGFSEKGSLLVLNLSPQD